MFKLHCDRCGQFVKEVGGPEAKEISLLGDTVCKHCKTSEDRLLKLADKMKRTWDTKLNEMIKEAKAELVAGLNEIKG